MCPVPKFYVLLRKMIYSLERKKRIRNDNHFLNISAGSVSGDRVFFLSAFSAKASFDLCRDVYNMGRPVS